MKQRVVLAGFALWLGVVAAGSGLTWLVIQRVGHVVSSQGPVADVPAVGPAGTVAPSASVSPTPSRSSPAGPRTARPSTGVPSRAATPRSTPRPTGGTTSAAPRPASPKPPAPRPTRRTSPAPAPASPPSSQPRPATVTRTWTGTGGRINVSCTGARAALVSASPADGWQVEVGDRGPEEVESAFRSSGSEVQVRVRCSGGEPRFEVERTSDG